jgi:cephalosporin hydroxylase
MLLHDAIWSSMPDLIIETGTYYGGSALWMAHILDELRQGTVLTVDRNDEISIPKHRRIQFIKSDSTSTEFIDHVDRVVKGHENVMVVLDSCHTAIHVFKELALLSPFVTIGQYLVVEDTNLNGNPVQGGFGPGPSEALSDWIDTEQGRCFATDTVLERKYGYSYFPGGWLKRVTGI